MNRAQRDAWLASSSKWNNLGPGWKGAELLGNGPSAIALFTHGGTDVDAPALKEVVVKQKPNSTTDPDLVALDIFPRTPFDEGNIQYKLSTARSKHIVRSYQGPLIDNRDPNAEVVRIFMEHCPGGDLDRFLRYQIADGSVKVGDLQRLDEADIWSIFHCIAYGLYVMENGVEDITAAVQPYIRDNTEIVHFDLTPDNVFMGYKDSTHGRMPVIKIGDFGDAADMTRDLPVSLRGRNMSRGTPEFQPPEENNYSSPLANPRKGYYSNVFQAGCIINCLITGEWHVFNGPERDGSGFSPKLCSWQEFPVLHGRFHHAQHLDDLDLQAYKIASYTRTLRALVIQCCMREPLHRPSTLSLVTQTQLTARSRQSS